MTKNDFVNFETDLSQPDEMCPTSTADPPQLIASCVYSTEAVLDFEAPSEQQLFTVAAAEVPDSLQGRAWFSIERHTIAISYPQIACEAVFDSTTDATLTMDPANKGTSPEDILQLQYISSCDTINNNDNSSVPCLPSLHESQDPSSSWPVLSLSSGSFGGGVELGMPTNCDATSTADLGYTNNPVKGLIGCSILGHEQQGHGSSFPVLDDQQQQQQQRMLGAGGENAITEGIASQIAPAASCTTKRTKSGKKRSKASKKSKSTSSKAEENHFCSSSKKKSTYKHVPHSMKPAHLVAKRNARERRRVHAVNLAFVKLRKAIPFQHKNGKRISKVRVLQKAIDYIQNMHELVHSIDEGSRRAQQQHQAQLAGNKEDIPPATGNNILAY